MASADVNFYAELGLEVNPDAPPTAADIRKAYRKRALECHPDKRPGDKQAALEFDRLQKAYDVLSDDAARKAYDALLAVQRERAARLQAVGGKRQRMVEELAEKERRAAQRQQQEEATRRDREEDVARQRLKAEVARIQREAKERELRAREQMREAGRQGEAAVLGGEGGEELQRTLKVSWGGKRSKADTVGAEKDNGANGRYSRESGAGNPPASYTAEELRRVFEAFGAVEDVVLREAGPGRGKAGQAGKGRALVVMGSRQAAVAAFRAAVRAAGGAVGAEGAAAGEAGSSGACGQAGGLGRARSPLTVALAVAAAPASAIWGDEEAPLAAAGGEGGGERGAGASADGAGWRGDPAGNGKGAAEGAKARGEQPWGTAAPGDGSRTAASAGGGGGSGGRGKGAFGGGGHVAGGGGGLSAATAGAGYHDFESAVLERMRQAAQRKREEAQAQEAQKADGANGTT